MQYTEINLFNDDSSSKQLEVTRLQQDLIELIEASDSIAELLIGWVSKGKVCFGTGIDNDENHTLVAFTFSAREPIAELFISISDIKQLYPQVRSIAEMAVVKSFDGFVTEWDTDEIDKLKADKDFKFSENLLEDVGSFEDALELSMSYAIAFTGECHISLSDDILKEEWEYELEELQPETVGWFHCMYQDPEKGRGFCESFAFSAHRTEYH